MRSPGRVLALLSIALAVPLVVACSSPATHLIGSTESDTVTPRIVFTARGTKQWSHPQAFGPVPAQLAEAGKIQCATLNHEGKTFSARGYHSAAQTADGYPFQDGGFFCVQD